MRKTKIAKKGMVNIGGLVGEEFYERGKGARKRQRGRETF
jgi:hypothetical protein